MIDLVLWLHNVTIFHTGIIHIFDLFRGGTACQVVNRTHWGNTEMSLIYHDSFVLHASDQFTHWCYTLVLTTPDAMCKMITFFT